VEVLRSGQPGMDAGLAAPGHGWPIAAGPRSRTGARVCRALARHRTSGAQALGYLALFQVTRRKGGTNSRRYPSNGYVHHQKTRHQTHSLREQARSHKGTGYIRRTTPLTAFSGNSTTAVTRIIRPTPNNHRDPSRNSRCIRLLKTRQMANLRAFYDPIVTGLSDETQYLDL